MSKTGSLVSRVAELKRQAREMGGELLLDVGDLIDTRHLHCLWYGSGQIGAFVYKGYTCSVEVVGDVDFGVLDKNYDECILEYKKPVVGGAYGAPEVLKVVKDDKTLEKLMDDGRIDFSLHNWVELRVFDENDEEIDVVEFGDVDGILDDNVLDAMGKFDDFVRLVENVLRERDERMRPVDERIAAVALRAIREKQEKAAGDFVKD